MVQHRALVNFLCSMQRKPGLSNADVLAAVTTISFDIAGLELYLPLMVGRACRTGAARDRSRCCLARSPAGGERGNRPAGDSRRPGAC